MVEVFSEESLWYASQLSTQSYHSRIETTLRFLNSFKSSRRVLEDQWLINFDDPYSAVLPIAYMITRWPSLKKKYSSSAGLGVIDLKRALLSLARPKSKSEDIAYLSVTADFESHGGDSLSTQEILEAMNDTTSAKDSERAVRWTLFKVNLRLVITMDCNGRMTARLNLKEPRRSWDATSKLLQRKQSIPRNFDSIQSERILFESLKVLPDLAKLADHSDHLTVILPNCFERGWTSMIRNLRANRSTEFIFLSIPDYYTRYGDLDGAEWPQGFPKSC